MSVTPAGILSRPLNALRQAVALSTAFQTWVDAADDDEALDRVYVLAAPDDFPDCPFAVVDFGEFKRERMTVNPSRPFQQMDPSESLLYFRAEVDPADDVNDAAYNFCNNVGAVISDLEAYAGDVLNGFPFIIQIEMIAAPTRIRFEERATAGDFFECTLAIHWSKQP
jgi:hypothetical protein